MINQQIEGLDNSSIQRLQVLRNKLIEYSQIVECLLLNRLEKLGPLIQSLILNPDFSKVSQPKQAVTSRSLI